MIEGIRRFFTWKDHHVIWLAAAMGCALVGGIVADHVVSLPYGPTAARVVVWSIYGIIVWRTFPK